MSKTKLVSDVKLYLTTSTVVGREHILTSLLYFQIIIESLKEVIRKKDLHLHAYVIMSNHVHYIVSTNEGTSLAAVMRDFNAHTSREIVSYLEANKKSRVLKIFQKEAKKAGKNNDYLVWKDDFDPAPIVGRDEFLQELSFVHENPVRRGYVDKPEHWQFSSARNYILGDHSIINVECLI